MPSYGPNSSMWSTERQGLDVRALLAELEDRRSVIKLQAFHEGSWDGVFDEACAVGPVIRKMSAEWGEWYCRLQQILQEHAQNEG